MAVEAEGAQPGDRVWLVLTIRYDKSLAIAVPEAMPEGRGLAPLGAPHAHKEVEGSLSETTLFVLLANANVETPARYELRVGEDVLSIPALPVVVNDAGPCHGAAGSRPAWDGRLSAGTGCPGSSPCGAEYWDHFVDDLAACVPRRAHPLPPTSRRSWWTQPRSSRRARWFASTSP